VQQLGLTDTVTTVTGISQTVSVNDDNLQP